MQVGGDGAGGGEEAYRDVGVSVDAVGEHTISQRQGTKYHLNAG
jgi:hypothetical protein